MATGIVKISGMTCMGCVNSVQKVLQAIDGVESAAVSLGEAQATVVYDATRAAPAQFKRAVEAAGYDAA